MNTNSPEMNAADKSNAERLQLDTYRAAKSFFEWNSGKNTPNILIQLSDRISELSKNVEISSKETSAAIASLTETINESSKSSGELSKSLNKITIWYAVVTAVGVLCTAAQVYLSFKSASANIAEIKGATQTPVMTKSEK
jgi:hypothetical protein